jgi:hypothetical protein
MARHLALVFLLIVLAAVMTPAQEYIPDNNTILLWHMNEVMPGNYVLDASGRGLNGQIQGGNGPYLVPGIYGNGIYLDAYITVTDPVLGFATGPFTIELWVRLDAPLYGGPLAYRPSDTAWQIAFNGNHELYFAIWPPAPGEGAAAIANVPITDGAWHHVAGVRDTDEVRLYVDGNLVAHADASNIQQLGTGESQTFFAYPDFPGAMDEIRVSNVARSPGEFNVAMPVNIDIRPGDSTNTIKLASAGIVPVGILGSASLDVNTIDPSTVSVAGARVKLVGKSDKYLCHVEDLNGDSFADLLCQVQTAQFIIEPGDSIAVLEAATYSGRRLRGQDSVHVRP